MAFSASSLSPLDPAVTEKGKKLVSSPAIKKALEHIRQNDAQCVRDQVEIASIESPRFGETNRRNKIEEILRRDGFKEIHTDSEGNLIARYPGSDPNGPRLVISGHMDTVFPENTPTQVRQVGNRYFAPGIGDDAKGVATCLQVMRTVKALNLALKGDLIFVGTVGEEANGDLRGSKHFFKENADKVDGFISVDGITPGAITCGATGSRRYKIEFDGIGGHSYKMFGIAPSANHALCRAVALFADIVPPVNPFTTFTVGTVNGGTSINSIASHAEAQLDMRSNAEESLTELESRIMPCFKEGARLENERYRAIGSEYEVKVKITQLGERPCGMQPDSSPTLQAARCALDLIGQPITSYRSASTDSNVPISLGIPAVTISAGGLGGQNHTVNEWYEHTDNAYEGPQAALLTVALLLGVDGVSDPLLAVRHTH